MNATSLNPQMVLLTLLGVVLLCIHSCQKKNEVTPLTTAQKIAKQWRVASAKISGTPTNAYNTWLIGFTVMPNGLPSTYVAGGNVPLNPARLLNGTWAFENGETRIVLNKGTQNESIFEILSISETKVVIRWTVPESMDKTKPTIEFELIPV